MNIKRSYFKLLMASATVGLFLANCTVRNSTDDSCEKGDKDTGCDCPGGLTGYQVCDSDGVFGECICPNDNSSAGSSSTAGKGSSTAGTGNEGGEPSSTGGKTSTAGTSAGGVAPVTGGAGGAGGEGGAAPVTFVPTDPNDCEACLAVLCKDEYETCVADESSGTTCFDQYVSIIDCIDAERENGLVKRDAVRACGVSVGQTSSGNLNDAWAPAEMLPATTDLLNCLATSSTDPQGPNPDWANDIPNNFPASGPTPWPEDSCAKLSCTAKFQ